MSKFILDRMLTALQPCFPRNAARTTVECGLNESAPDSEVVARAFKDKAILVTADKRFVRHCKEYQKSLSHRLDRKCMFGLLVLPDRDEIQRRVLTDIRSRKRKLRHPHYDREVTWEDVRRDNLVVNGRTPDLQVQELCNCEWEEDS